MREFDGKDTAQVVNFAQASASQKRRDCFESHRHRVFALAFYMTGGEREAEQVLGETFVRAFQHSDSPTGEQVDHSLMTELKEHVEFAPVSAAPVVSTAGGALLGQRNVKRPDLEAALGHLPATERMVFLLRDVEGYTPERTAETMELTVAQVNLALLKARLLLRNALAKAGPMQAEPEHMERKIAV